MKKFSVTVTKSDAETGTAQGDASLAGAVYGIYKGETLVDTYTTDKNGQFVTKEYICDNDWTVREITPSEGYLLDATVHKIGAEPQLYTVEHLHCHFVVNSVSFRDGKRLQNKEKAWWYFRHIADEVCLEHGLSVVQNPEAYQSPRILTQKDKAGM